MLPTIFEFPKIPPYFYCTDEKEFIMYEKDNIFFPGLRGTKPGYYFPFSGRPNLFEKEEKQILETWKEVPVDPKNFMNPLYKEFPTFNRDLVTQLHDSDWKQVYFNQTFSVMVNANKNSALICKKHVKFPSKEYDIYQYSEIVREIKDVTLISRNEENQEDWIIQDSGNHCYYIGHQYICKFKTSGPIVNVSVNGKGLDLSKEIIITDTNGITYFLKKGVMVAGGKTRKSIKMETISPSLKMMRIQK